MDNPGIPAARAATPCPICHRERCVTSATIAGGFVYLRCETCAHVWAISDRRATRRPEDAVKVFK
jgi:hypothetical protein